MSRSAFAVAVCLAVGTVSPGSAAQLSLRFVTADGTWDCWDDAGGRVGAVVVANMTYAFVTPEGKVAGYGTIRPVDGDFDLPKFTVMTGHLKDEKKVLGFSLGGPQGDTENFSGEILMRAVVGFDNKQFWDCVRRGGRANQPPA